MNEKNQMINRILQLIDNDPKSKSQILRELHLSTSTLTDWERGKGNPSSSAIIKLAQYFNVSTDYLLLGKDTFSMEEITENSGKARLSQWVQYFYQLSEQEQQLCIAFICGILAEKDLNN